MAWLAWFIYWYIFSFRLSTVRVETIMPSCSCLAVQVYGSSSTRLSSWVPPLCTVLLYQKHEILSTKQVSLATYWMPWHSHCSNTGLEKKTQPTSTSVWEAFMCCTAEQKWMRHARHWVFNAGIVLSVWTVAYYLWSNSCLLGQALASEQDMIQVSVWYTSSIPLAFAIASVWLLLDWKWFPFISVLQVTHRAIVWASVNAANDPLLYCSPPKPNFLE